MTRMPPALFGQRPIPLAAGIGLRPAHYDRVFARRPTAAWFEVHAENHMTGSQLAASLLEIAASHPLSLHAVGLSLGSPAGPEESHLARLRELVNTLSPALVSDHLSWSAVDGIHLPDLLPLPYTEEALGVVVRNIHVVQDRLRRRLVVENPSRYLSLPDSSMSEADFFAELVLRTGCGVLLDVNNLYVTATNTGTSPAAQLNDFLAKIAPEDIAEIHLAGHTSVSSPPGASLLVDHHGAAVCTEVWALFEAVVADVGPVPSLVEWDSCVPSFETLQAEAATVQSVLSLAL
jgi:uncharacterized protein (UPF0276 family)